MEEVIDLKNFDTTGTLLISRGGTLFIDIDVRKWLVKCSGSKFNMKYNEAIWPPLLKQKGLF